MAVYYSDAKQSQKPISLVILDKDGTLVEFGTGWSEWVTQLSNWYVHVTKAYKCVFMYLSCEYSAKNTQTANVNKTQQGIV